jgi:hypothetical protein
VFALDNRAKQYRKNAADLLMLSHEATTRASQDYWRTMAEFWFKLAQHVEKTEAAGNANQGSVPMTERPISKRSHLHKTGHCENSN